LADLEKRRKIKSREFVNDSDDESDEERDREFFAREDARRKGQGAKVMEALRAGRITQTIEGEKVKPKLDSGNGSRKRKSGAVDGVRKKRRKGSSLGGSDRSDDDGILDVNMEDDVMSDSPPRRGPFGSDSEDDDRNEDTPLSSPPMDGLSLGREGEAAQPEIVSAKEDVDTGDGEEDEDDAPVISTARRRGKIAIFDDSDDE